MLDLKITDVRVLPGDSGFLIDDGRTSILYDSGFAFTGYKLAENIKKALGERTLDYIFLTHSHYDHAAGSAYAKEVFPGTKVVAGEYAAKIFAKASAKMVMRDLDRKFALKCGVEEYEDLIDNLCVDIPVSDGDMIDAGDIAFEVIHLPGHTKCSVGYYCRDRKFLLAPETLGVYGGKNVVVPAYLVGYQMTMESIAKAKKLEIEYILTPHYGIICKEETKAFLNNAETSCRLVAERIHHMIKEGRNDEEILGYVSDNFYNEYTKTIYPKDAMELNTRIMIELVKKEWL